MHGIPPHLLPSLTPPPKTHFHCSHCGYDNDGDALVRCPKCGRPSVTHAVPAGRFFVLGAMICATVIATCATYWILWKKSDHVTGLGRAMTTSANHRRELAALCAEECWIRALIVFLACAAVCLGYAYFRVFEPAQARRLMARIKNACGT